MTPPVLITMGDPAGIGPELCLRALREPAVQAICRPLVVGSAALARRVASAAGLPPPETVIPIADWLAGSASPVTGAWLDTGLPLGARTIEPGRVQAAAGHEAFRSIRAAVDPVIRGRAVALVTAPINKAALHLADIPYPGHTEMLANMTGAWRYGMMLASDHLIVSLVTIHLGLADVPGRLTIEGILDTIRLTADALRRLGKSDPRLTVCGLNPHAGESGLFGTEETRLILPAIAQARQDGLTILGPLPPDTAFVPDIRAQTDAYIVMYHDQGLIPFKMLAFESGVNITLGLPIVRTSPDHGTAFDIAWKNQASATSFIEAIRWAVRLAGTSGSTKQP